jgi:predicted DNA-binding protein (MmcQ/YjbR family)
MSRRMAAVRRWLDAKPGAVPVLLSARKRSPPISAMYKVKGKIFAIVSLRETEFVILKCDPHLATVLRAQYEGVGHRSHLDRRFWISIDLDSDVPSSEIKRLISHSYELVCATLTAKQKTELGR